LVSEVWSLHNSNFIIGNTDKMEKLYIYSSTHHTVQLFCNILDSFKLQQFQTCSTKAMAKVKRVNIKVTHNNFPKLRQSKYSTKVMNCFSSEFNISDAWSQERYSFSNPSSWNWRRHSKFVVRIFFYNFTNNNI